MFSRYHLIFKWIRPSGAPEKSLIRDEISDELVARETMPETVMLSDRLDVEVIRGH